MADDTEAQWRRTCENIAQATPREWGALDQRYYDAGLALIAAVRAENAHALAESVKLQAHYAELLNMHDGGQRMVFPTVEAWLERLTPIEHRRAEQHTPRLLMDNGGAMPRDLLPPQSTGPCFGPETDTWEDRGYPGPPVCRCGHERDQHGSRTEQRDGQKVYVQKCEQCPCEVFVERDGPLSQLIDSFGPIQRYGTVGNVIRTTEGEPGYDAERRQQERERPAPKSRQSS